MVFGLPGDPYHLYQSPLPTRTPPGATTIKALPLPFPGRAIDLRPPRPQSAFVGSGRVCHLPARGDTALRPRAQTVHSYTALSAG